MKTFFDGRLIVQTGDITAINVDAIVNAANSSLMGGGGVDGAIHRAGGPEILEECRKLRASVWPGGLPAGKAASTTGGRLTARRVIHTVGPVWHGGEQGEDELLADAYRNSLSCAENEGLTSIAFPAISTGVYGFPRERAAGIVGGLLQEYFSGSPRLREIRLVFFREADASAFL
ncbi:MAG: O-acetyl-ADP-ribose deacetylase, partial [Spirochaetales bacterium]|nr:O-acetyl-ADP-ribose deacetylase [Spirochaetales bacterium]